MRLVRISLICAAVATFVAMIPPTPASAGSPRGKLVAKINNFRAAHGLPKLRGSRSLYASSTRYSRKMARRNFFGHQARIEASARFRPLGEALEYHGGRTPQVRRTLRRLAASPAHRALLLNPSFNYIGTGYAYSRRNTFWTVHLGRR